MSAFFCDLWKQRRRGQGLIEMPFRAGRVFCAPTQRLPSINDILPTVAQQIAQAAIASQQQRTGHAPVAVTVVLSADTLVVTLHDALTPAEKVLVANPEWAAQVQEFHRQLFANSCEQLRQEIAHITGVQVREAAAEVETSSGTVFHAFTSGAIVQVFLLAGKAPADAWSDDELNKPL
jgi:uncharacterized protein YbcI